MRVPANRPLRLELPTEVKASVVVISDPADNNVVKKVVQGDIIRVELLARVWGRGPWQVISQTGSVGKLTDRGIIGEVQVFEWDTRDVKPGRFSATMQRPESSRSPPRVFTAIADITAQTSAKAKPRQ